MQAARNARVVPVPTELLEACSTATATLKHASGPEVDQHGFTSRIHGNAAL
jgi:hypothetical protein